MENTKEGRVINLDVFRKTRRLVEVDVREQAKRDQSKTKPRTLQEKTFEIREEIEWLENFNSVSLSGIFKEDLS